jgi:hypothetical protein
VASAQRGGERARCTGFSRRFWLGIDYAGNEPIALFGQRLDIAGFRNLVAQGQPNLPDRIVESLVEFDKGRIAPDASAQLLPRHNLAATLQQNAQNAQRLGLNLYRPAIAKEFPRLESSSNSPNFSRPLLTTPIFPPHFIALYTLRSDEEALRTNS